MTVQYSKENTVGGWSVYRESYGDGIMLFANKIPIWLPKTTALRLAKSILESMTEYWSIDYHPDELHIGLSGPMKKPESLDEYETPPEVYLVYHGKRNKVHITNCRYCDEKAADFLAPIYDDWNELLEEYPDASPCLICRPDLIQRGVSVQG